MTSKNERVNSFSFLLFCHAGEILVEREKKNASQNRQSLCVCLLFLENNKNPISKDFHGKMRCMMVYQFFFIFLYFLIIRRLIAHYFNTVTQRFLTNQNVHNNSVVLINYTIFETAKILRPL